MGVIRTISIGNLVIPFSASHDMTQTYSRVSGGTTTLRMENGDGIKQTKWEKLQTTISGGGVVASGLHDLPLRQPLLIKCAAPQLVHSSSNVITIPANRRTDTGYEPWGLAVMSDSVVETVSCSVTGDVCTLAIMPGARSYAAGYTPQFTGLIVETETSHDLTNALPSWSITVEEK